MAGSRVAQQLATALKGATQSRSGLGRIEERVGNAALILQGETHDLHLFNRSQSRIAGCAHHEVSQGSTLHVRCTLEKRMNVRGQTSFEPCYLLVHI